jgi:hypothetical protein
VVVLASYVVSACAYAPTERIVNNANDYNLAVERTNNQMLLLNILRASQRRPMYFTAVSTLRGSITTEFRSGDITIPFGPGPDPAGKRYQAAPGVTFQTNPQFDVGVLDSERFYRGLLSAVSPDLARYYIDQGWPPELLIHLLIRRIDIGGHSFVNLPEEPAEVIRFQNVARFLFSCAADGGHIQCDFKSSTFRDVGPPVEESAISSIQDVVAIDQAGFSLREVPSPVPCENALDKSAPRKGNITSANCKRYFQLSTRDEDSLRLDSDQAGAVEGITLQDCDENGRLTLHILTTPSKRLDGGRRCAIHLRSPEAMLYYLGEIARIQVDAETRQLWMHKRSKLTATDWPDDEPNVYIHARDTCSVPLFRLQRGSRTDSAIEVLYEDQRYIVPKDRAYGAAGRCGKSRSMHALSLVHQVLSLQKSREDLPTTQTVNVIGPTR